MSKEDFIIKKLKGSENYSTWQFAMRNYLEFNDLLNCIIPKADNPEAAMEDKDVNLRKAKSRLVLSVEECLYVHIEQCTTPLQIWLKFKNLFEDKGWIRKIGLLRALIGVRLKNCDNMQDYIERITGASNKLISIGFMISDDWLGAILLAGLSEEYKLMIMSFEGSVTVINADTIKMKLLDSQYNKAAASNNALMSKKSNEKTSKKPRGHIKCYKCGKKGHISVNCHSKEGSSKSNPNHELKNNNTSNKPAKHASAAFHATESSISNEQEWYIDSGASNHMTAHTSLMRDKVSSCVGDIIVANNTKMKVDGVRKISLSIKKSQIEINDVLHVPQLAVNLLSVSKIAEATQLFLKEKIAQFIMKKVWRLRSAM